MTEGSGEASRWRVELAGELAPFYTCHPGVLMVCLGGSSSRGFADEWSDLDMVVYWNEIDARWIEKVPLPVPRTDLTRHPSGPFTESYHLDGLKVDFGHVRLADWESWMETLFSNTSPAPELIGVASGFLHSIVLHGGSLHERIRDRLSTYPRALSVSVIRENMRFFVNGYLEGQCLDRGDLLAYQDGMLLSLKKILNITAALNRYYFHAGEARWVEKHIESMPLRPPELTWSNILRMVHEPGREALGLLEGLQRDVLALVAAHLPELSQEVDARLRRMESLAVRPCFGKPELVQD